MTNVIYHQGIVEDIDGSHVRVRIEQTSACSGCSIRSRCTAVDSIEKLIDVTMPKDATFIVGDHVQIVGEVSLGLHAVMWAFVWPLLILLFFLLLFIIWSGNEILSSLGAVVLLIPYYYILWLKRAKFKQKFLFTIKSNNQ